MVILVSLICLLNIGSGTYIAFGAITSLSSLALYISYAIAISSMLYARYINKTPLRLGEWNLGRFGGAINVFALVYTLYMIIWLPFPGTLLVLYNPSDVHPADLTQTGHGKQHELRGRRDGSRHHCRCVTMAPPSEQALVGPQPNDHGICLRTIVNNMRLKLVTFA